MNSNSTAQPVSANQDSETGFEITELNSNDWWLHQIREIQNWSPGGVFVLFLGPVSCVAPAAAWFTTATGLIQLDGQPLFAQRLVVAPPGYGDSDYKGRFCASIENTYKANGKAIPTDLLQALENPVCFLEESDCDHVLAQLEKLPEGSAVGICAAQRLRFHDLVPERGPEIKTHTGLTVHHTTGEGLTFPHLAMVDGILRRAITASCQRNDPELFLLAATWLSQPSLAASRANWQLFSDRPEAKLANMTELFPVGTEPVAARVRDYSQAMQRQIERTESNFKKLALLPLAAVRYVATPTEAFCFLAHDSKGRLCRLVVRRDGIEGPTRLDETEWDQSQFIEWQRTYPEGYSWDRNYGTFGDYDIPDLNDIRASLNKLQAAIPADCKTLTILPEADLFGFTFFLNEQKGHWVGELTQCVTAPSLPWLATVRQLPQPKLCSLKAWLGHPTLADNAVARPRSELRPILMNHDGQLIEAETPQLLGKADIAVVLSHGSRGLFRGFVGFDDVGKFTVEELAVWLGECKCVILFVCNAGRSDVRLFHNETFGLVGRLLRRDVRAVIAPPAPLRNNLPAIWLAPFLEYLCQGQAIGVAHANACDALRTQFSHPCAWGALQLYGDPALTFVANLP